MTKKERKKKITNEMNRLETEKRTYVRSLNSKNKEFEKCESDIRNKTNKINDYQLRINLGGVADCRILEYDNNIKVLNSQIDRIKNIESEINSNIEELEAKIQATDNLILEQKNIMEKIDDDCTDSLADWTKKITWKGNDVESFGVKSQENAINFFKWYPKYMGKLEYDIINCDRLFDKKSISDSMITKMMSDYEHNVGLTTRAFVKDGVYNVCDENEINMFIEKLEELELWDGKKRLEEFFIRYLGAEDSSYTRHMTKNMFYSMIKRVYEPGCPVDFMIILQDEHQGSGKSKIIGRLLESIGCKNNYVLLKKPNLSDRDKIQEIQKAMVAYVDEMKEFMKADVDTCKEFVTNQIDRGRFAYAHNNGDYPRHWILIGNTNLQYFLKDYSTDNVERRYIVIECNLENSIEGGDKDDRSARTWWDEHLPFEECRQILAEALYYYKNEPEYEYQKMTKDELEHLLDIQQRHKTSGADETTNSWLINLLNEKYVLNDVGEFRDERDFLQQIEKHDNIYFDTDGNNILYSSINTIPADWVMKFLKRKKELNGKSVNYVLSMIDKTKWYRRQDKYYAGTCYKDVFYRKKS